jgi:hypothetical protein
VLKDDIEKEKKFVGQNKIKSQHWMNNAMNNEL